RYMSKMEKEQWQTPPSHKRREMGNFAMIDNRNQCYRGYKQNLRRPLVDFRFPCRAEFLHDNIVCRGLWLLLRFFDTLFGYVLVLGSRILLPLRKVEVECILDDSLHVTPYKRPYGRR